MASRPGAMSLLDKYSSINTSIEDARRRVAEVSSDVERANEKIDQLNEERKSMLTETETAKAERLQLEAEIKKQKAEHSAQVLERDRAQRDRDLASAELAGTREQIDAERTAFLERGREFRASCKRMSVAASILLLEGGDVEAKRASGEANVQTALRELMQEEEFSDDDNAHESTSDGGAEYSNAKKRKKTDPEMDRTEKDEKESREALIGAECVLHSERANNDDAVRRKDIRKQRLTQQRAQLQRHRKEVEEIVSEIQQVKDAIVEENQLAGTFEKEYNRRKQLRLANSNVSCSRHFNPPSEESTQRSNSYNFNNSNSSNTNNYQQRHNNYNDARNPYSNNQSNYASPQPMTSSVNQHISKRRTAVNPYKSSRTSVSLPNASGNGRRGLIAEASNSPPYASDILNGKSPGYGQGQQRGREPSTQDPRGRRIRNQRQFGTSVNIRTTTDSGMGLEECMAAFPRKEITGETGRGEDEVSSASSSDNDEEFKLFDLDIFGKK